MTFLHPLLLLAAAGIALPILAHLLNRHRVQHTPWAAMQFLDQSVRVRSRQLRLRDLLLLALRCLAVLMLALAFARPAVEKVADWLPGERRAGVLIAWDSSFSMQQETSEGSRFDKAMDRVRTIAERIPKGDPVTLVKLGRAHQVVQRSMAFDAESFAATLNRQSASAGRTDWDSVFTFVKPLVEEMDAHQREVYFVTDTQAVDWQRRQDQIRDGLNDLGSDATVVLAPVAGSSENLAVTELTLISGELRKGAVARYQATVRNCGEQPVSNVEVACLVDGVTTDTKRISAILPGASESVSLFAPFHNAGATRITAKISGDLLGADNTRHVTAVVRDRVSILVVDGSTGDAGRLISSALLARDGGGEEDDFVVRSVPWLSFPAEQLVGVDVVVMSNVPQVTADQARRLSQFVRDGRGLVWFGGDQVKAAEWNSHFSKSATEDTGAALLPAKIGPIVESTDALGAGKPFDPILPEHVLARPLRALPGDLFSEARFLKRFQVEPTESSFSVLGLAGSEAPILIEQGLGRGHVVMFTTSADVTWNNMALTPIFPMLMQQVVTYLAGREFEQPRVVGDSLTLTYAEQPDASDAEFDTPSGETVSAPVRQIRNEYVARLGEAREAGFYTARVSVQAPGMPIAVNVDTRESDVKCLPPSEIVRLLDGANVVVAANGTDLLNAIDAQRPARSTWRFFMLAALGLLLVESLVADWIQRKQHSGNEPLATNLQGRASGEASKNA